MPNARKRELREVREVREVRWRWEREVEFVERERESVEGKSELLCRCTHAR
jgi:hypothetical protein